MQKKTVTIKDISARLNVSLSTVNKALTGKSGISEKRRQEILHVADEMGYSVNHAAQSLSRKPIEIGVIIPSMWQQYFASVVRGFQIEFESMQQMNVIGVLKMAESMEAVEEAFEDLFRKSIHAIIYCPSLIPLSEKMHKRIKSKEIPIFLAGSGDDEIRNACTISVNTVLSGRMAAEFLKLLLPEGAQIAAFTGSKDIKVHADKVKAFTSYASELGMNLVSIYETLDDPELVTTCTAKLYREYPNVKGIYLTTAIAAPLLDYVSAMQPAKRPVIVGTDVYEEVLVAMRQGLISGTIFQNQVLMGRMAVKMAYQYLIGQSSYNSTEMMACRRVLVNPHLFLSSNAERFELEDGNDYICEE